MKTLQDQFDYYSALPQESCDIGEHLRYMHDLAVSINAQTIVELGPARGVSTAAWLLAAETTGGHVWSCDILEQDIFPEVAEHEQWTYVVANDLDVVDRCPRPIDLLFIDSEHTYQQTLDEMRAYVPLVRSGGYVLMHDTVIWDELIEPAIREYAAEHPFASERWFMHCNGLFVGQTL